MNILAVLMVSFVCLATSDKPSYRDVLEKIQDRLEQRIEERIQAEMTEGEEAAGKETKEQELERLLRILRNKGQMNDESMEKKKLQAVSIARPICRPNVLFDYRFCCEPGFTYIDLANNASCQGINTASGVKIINGPAEQRTSEDCSKMALLKVNFERFTKEPCDYCARKPLCGRRMLRIDLKLSHGPRSGFGFNIGDSRTNNGYAGDASTQENDCEAEGTFPNVRVWASDKCYAKSLKVFSNAIGTAVNDVTIYVSNGYIRIVNDQGFDDYLCDKCLYALNGQSDNQGTVNEDIYIGLNRVVQSTYRNGYGVCSATLSWSCPYW